MKRCDQKVESAVVGFCPVPASAAAGAAAATVMPQKAEAAAPLARVAYPSNRLANVSDLKPDTPLEVSYPDADAPGVLLKLGAKVPGGVGPQGTSSASPPYARTRVSRSPTMSSDKSMNCPGHYSRFDCENGGQQIWGQATQKLPQYVLRVDAKGDIYADGLDELLYGRLSNVSGGLGT